MMVRTVKLGMTEGEEVRNCKTGGSRPLANDVRECANRLQAMLRRTLSRTVSEVFDKQYSDPI